MFGSLIDRSARILMPIHSSLECVQVLYSTQWDSILILYKVLKRYPTERYIKPVRIRGYCSLFKNFALSLYRYP